MTYLADRMSLIDASGIRKVFALAAKMKDPVNLSIGQPDYDVDLAVKETAIEAIRDGFNGYTQTWGDEALRGAVQDYYDRRFGVRPENVMVTSGVSGGLFLGLMATVNPGDEVLFADPYFVMYPHLVRLLGGKPVAIDTYPDFKLTPEAVAAAVTPMSKILIINAPANPTGVSLTQEELDALVAEAKRHNLLVITDEIYEALLYDDAPATAVGRYENILLLNGLSKSAAMTGWRVGFAAGPEALIQAMNTLQQYTYVCAPAPAQKAAITALSQDMTDKVDRYRRKRDIIYDGLRQLGLAVTRPGGAFYIFPEAPGGDGDAFVLRAIENNLLVIPGSVFSARKTHFRISFAASDDTLREGLAIIAKLRES